MSTTRPLTLEDIADQRAYERERDEFRRAGHRRARSSGGVSIGPVVTLAFESRMTMRFQVQEMARAEKMTTDEQIQHELDVYNRLLPAPGRTLGHPVPRADHRGGAAHLAAPPGRDRAVRGARDRRRAPGPPRPLGARRGAPVAADPGDLTSAVHYVRFRFTPAEAAAMAVGTGRRGGRPRGLSRGASRCRAVRRHPGRAGRRPGRRVTLTDARSVR